MAVNSLVSWAIHNNGPREQATIFIHKNYTHTRTHNINDWRKDGNTYGPRLKAGGGKGNETSNRRVGVSSFDQDFPLSLDMRTFECRFFLCLWPKCSFHSFFRCCCCYCCCRKCNPEQWKTISSGNKRILLCLSTILAVSMPLKWWRRILLSFVSEYDCTSITSFLWAPRTLHTEMGSRKCVWCSYEAAHNWFLVPIAPADLTVATFHEKRRVCRIPP